MSYKIRNSIALGVLLFLVFVVGGYVSFISQPGKLKGIAKESKHVESQLQDKVVQERAISDMQNTLRETIHRWNNRLKEIPQFDISSQTYGYLSRIIDESGFMKLNMSFNGTKSLSKYGYNTYHIIGSAEFPNIFRFMWLLENGRRLYKITTIAMKSEEKLDTAGNLPTIQLNYEMDIQSYFTSEKSLNTPVMNPDSTPEPITSNPFEPFIFGEVPKNTRNLVDVSNLSVKAVADSKALVMDGSGRLITLKLGDPVYLGKVETINPEDGSIVFRMNRGGIIDTVRKQIIFDKMQRGMMQ